MAFILRYFAEFGSFRGQLHKSGWLAINRFSPEKCHKAHVPTKHDGRAVLFAAAELLIFIFARRNTRTHTDTQTPRRQYLLRSLWLVIAVNVTTKNDANFNVRSCSLRGCSKPWMILLLLRTKAYAACRSVEFLFHYLTLNDLQRILKVGHEVQGHWRVRT